MNISLHIKEIIGNSRENVYSHLSNNRGGWNKPERTKQMEEILNFQVPAEG